MRRAVSMQVNMMYTKQAGIRFWTSIRVNLTP